MLIHELGAEQIVVSPVSTGFGQVHCAHGILPVPAPATALLLTGIPCKAGTVEGELCTPTGAAISTGFGQVHCAHGILPVPAPATALLLTGIPCKAGTVEGELCTPTGAAILKYFATSYGKMPEMVMDKIGYGMGKKDFPAANCVRAILGNTV